MKAHDYALENLSLSDTQVVFVFKRFGLPRKVEDEIKKRG